MRDIVIYTGSNQDLVRRLFESGARYMVIGSTAARFHVPDWSEPNDLDLVIEPSEETARKVVDAVSAIVGRRIIADPRLLARPNTGFPEKTVLNVDVLTPIPRFDFAEHWALAEDANMAYGYGTIVRVASIQTLIAWKRLALLREAQRAGAIARDIEVLEQAVQNRQRP